MLLLIVCEYSSRRTYQQRKYRWEIVLINFVIIDGTPLARIGLKGYLKPYENFNFIAEANNATEGLKLLETLKPDVALVDINLFTMESIELIRKFKRHQKKSGLTATKIFVLTTNNTKDSILAAFSAGVNSYYLTTSEISYLKEAIKITHNGYSWIDYRIAPVILNKIQQNDQIPQIEKLEKIEELNNEYLILTSGELEVMELIIQNYSITQVAEKLQVTDDTVKTYVSSILNKLRTAELRIAKLKITRGEQMPQEGICKSWQSYF